MTSRTVTPLYDQALEAVLDDDVVCENRDCDALAVVRAVAVPCGCARLLCHEHRMRLLLGLAIVEQGLAKVECGRHPNRDLTADDFRIYPI